MTQKAIYLIEYGGERRLVESATRWGAIQYAFAPSIRTLAAAEAVALSKELPLETVAPKHLIVNPAPAAEEGGAQ
jgi:hypothetical protein